MVQGWARGGNRSNNHVQNVITQIRSNNDSLNSCAWVKSGNGITYSVTAYVSAALAGIQKIDSSTTNSEYQSGSWKFLTYLGAYLQDREHLIYLIYLFLEKY